MNSIEKKSFATKPETDDLEIIARTFLEGFPPDRVRAILAEARRLRGRLSAIPWYKSQAEQCGQEMWLKMAVSYQGEA